MTHEPHDQHDAGGVQPPGGHGSHGGYPDHSGYGDVAYADAGYGESGYGESGYGESGYGDTRHAENGYGEGGYGYGGHGDGYGAGYGDGQSYGPAHGYHPAPAPGSWGGEYDSDATAFVQLPGPGIGLPAGADPLAAPGTGQGGYTPPSLADFEHRGGPGLSEPGGHAPSGPADAPVTHAGQSAYGVAPMTPAATTDPSATGQWTMPFAAATTDPADFGTEPEDVAGRGPADTEAAEAYAHLDTPATGADAADPTAHDADAAAAAARSRPQPGGAAAAMGQGAAAALAGSHEARTQRRPLGTGGAASRTDEPLDADDSALGTDSAPGAPDADGAPPLTDAVRPAEGGPQAEDPVADPYEQFADSMARRQVPFAAAAAPEAVSWPEPGTLSVPRPADPDAAEQAAQVPPHQDGPIPYADSSPGHSAPVSRPDGDLGPAPGAKDGGVDLPAPRTPAAPGEGGGGTGAGPTWPEPGTLPVSGGEFAPVPGGGFAESTAAGMAWPEPGDLSTPAGTAMPVDAGTPSGDGATPDPGATAGADADESAPATAPAAGSDPAAAGSGAAATTPSGHFEGSPPSRIPFVASTPGREAPPLTTPETDGGRAAASDQTVPDTAPTGETPTGETPTGEAPTDAAPAGERHDAAVERPAGADEDAPGDHPAGELDTTPGAEAWSGTATPGPDDSGEYAAVPADPVPAEPVPGADPQPVPSAHSEHPHVSYVLRVNGVDRPVTEAWIGESLLYVLRERLGLAGAKDGCSQGECGACSVQVDGRLVASCLVPAATAAGSEVRTVEGLAGESGASDVQRALARCGAVQCGFCVPGLAMAVHELLEGNHAPTELETRQAICGNLCRCSGYRGVLEAVETVVSERAAAQAAEDEEEAEASSEGGDA